MNEQKRFHVNGRVRPTPQPKESDGVDYDFVDTVQAGGHSGEALMRVTQIPA